MIEIFYKTTKSPSDHQIYFKKFSENPHKKTVKKPRQTDGFSTASHFWSAAAGRDTL